MCTVASARRKLSLEDFQGAVAEAGAILAANPRDQHAQFITAFGLAQLGHEAVARPHLRSCAKTLMNTGQPIFAILVIKRLSQQGDDITPLLDELSALYSNEAEVVDTVDGVSTVTLRLPRDR